MTKQEFLDILGKALRRELSVQEAEKNLEYYEQYISQRVRDGMTEAQVLAELGNPRLIAKTILQVEQQKEDAEDGAESVYTEDSDGNFREEKAEEESGIKIRSLSGIKAWLILALILVIVFVLLKTAFVIAWKLLPLLLLGGGIWWLYQKFVQR